MFNRDELECVVCCHEFSRSNRIPRVLHCHHTFCIQCLEKLSRHAVTMQTIPCPLCRWITCTPPDQTLSEALYINTEIWSHIPEHEQEQEQEENEDLPVVFNDAKPLPKSKLKRVISFFKGY